jgi:hypothetical protein
MTLFFFCFFQIVQRADGELSAITQPSLLRSVPITTSPFHAFLTILFPTQVPVGPPLWSRVAWRFPFTSCGLALLGSAVLPPFRVSHAY